ncbi:hypothetical protein Tsubulata_023143 [Turnera subulata]|uniref:Uncharacterized protein n=1 Tax=Turnera subulata TaxID=218843 RepID=A0A9Q0FWH6_9ROSI|nr:hypothetical protein Tsubulata_023143 [Turnera subulata]
MVQLQSLAITPPTATPISTTSRTARRHAPSMAFQRVSACHGDPKPVSDNKLIHRRTVSLGLAAAVVGLNIGGRDANAARRPPPPPATEERKDPSVSGVQAKVLASKKRKEAMKQSVAKLREKGKPASEAAPKKPETKAEESQKPTSEASPEEPIKEPSEAIAQ